MKTIAVIQADLETTPLGTRSRLADELLGVPVLRRTVERVRRADGIEQIHVLTPTGQVDRCEKILDGTTARVRGVNTPGHPWSALVQTARKWSLDGWRGGIGGTTHFDEFTDPRLISGLLKEVKADLVLSVPPGAALIDPEVIEGMIRHRENVEAQIRLVFAPAPPGVAGILLDADLVHELAEKSSPVGWILSYKPDNPQKDLTTQPCCYELPQAVRHAVGRLTADTRRSFETVATILRDLDDPTACDLGTWLQRHDAESVEALPREVEIELTTDDPYPNNFLRPRGTHVMARGPIEPKTVARIAAEVATYDDALMVLGGFGDPLRHPRLAEVLGAIREGAENGAGVYGLAVRTAGVDLNDERIAALIEYRVDVVQVTLDAWTQETYSRLQAPDEPSAANLEAVLARVDRLNANRQARGQVCPITVPDMTKVRENVHELDDFHDGWLRRVGAVSITGHSHFAGQFDDRSVIRMAPSAREPCRRLRSRCLILADGRMVMCDQDFNGRVAVGNVKEQSFGELWQTAELARIRQAHREGRFDPTDLCATCDDWHRP